METNLATSAEFARAPITEMPLDRDPRVIYLKSLAASGRRSVERCIERAARVLTSGALGAEEFPWWEIRKAHVARLRSELAEPTSPYAARHDGQPVAPKTANLVLSSVRGVLREAMDLGLLEPEEYVRIQRVKTIVDSRPLAGRALTLAEIRRLFDACSGDSLRDRRDRALLAILFGGGLRRTEVAGLALEDWNDAGGSLRVRRAKGNRQRDVAIRGPAADAIRRWVEVRGDEPGGLLLSIRHGRLRAGHLSEQTIYDATNRIATRAGVAKFSPHDARRSAATYMLQAGADLIAVSRQLGHASPVTTSRYDRRGEKAQEDAADRLMAEFGL